jgi:hypothetical protein
MGQPQRGVFALSILAAAAVAGCGGGISTTVTTTVPQAKAPGKHREERKHEQIREWHKTEAGLRRLLLIEAQQAENCLRQHGYTGTTNHFGGQGVVPATPSGSSLVLTGVKSRHGIFYIGVAGSHHNALEYLYSQMEEVTGGSERLGSYSGAVAIVRDQVPEDPIYQSYLSDVTACAMSLPTTAGQFKEAPRRSGKWDKLLPGIG